jgi:hypothetical protein
MTVQDSGGMDWAARLKASLRRDDSADPAAPEAADTAAPDAPPAEAAKMQGTEPTGDIGDPAPLAAGEPAAATDLPPTPQPDARVAAVEHPADVPEVAAVKPTPKPVALGLLDFGPPDTATTPPLDLQAGLLSTLSPTATAPARPAMFESPLLVGLGGALMASVPAPQPETAGSAATFAEASPLLASIRTRRKRDAAMPDAKAPANDVPKAQSSPPEAPEADGPTSAPETAAPAANPPPRRPKPAAAGPAAAAPDPLPASTVAPAAAPVADDIDAIALQHSIGTAGSGWAALFAGAAATTPWPLNGIREARLRGLKPALHVTESHGERLAGLRASLESEGLDGGEIRLLQTAVEADPARLSAKATLAQDLLDGVESWDLLRIGLPGLATTLLDLDTPLLTRKVRWLMLLPVSRMEEADALRHLLRARWRLVAERPAVLNPARPAIARQPGAQLWRGPLA